MEQGHDGELDTANMNKVKARARLLILALTHRLDRSLGQLAKPDSREGEQEEGHRGIKGELQPRQRVLPRNLLLARLPARQTQQNANRPR